MNQIKKFGVSKKKIIDELTEKNIGRYEEVQFLPHLFLDGIK